VGTSKRIIFSIGSYALLQEKQCSTVFSSPGTVAHYVPISKYMIVDGTVMTCMFQPTAFPSWQHLIQDDVSGDGPTCKLRQTGTTCPPNNRKGERVVHMHQSRLNFAEPVNSDWVQDRDGHGSIVLTRYVFRYHTC
jgi:hypothetical protein